MPVEERADHDAVVFLGTSVVSGTAAAEVVDTGPRTRFGDIAGRLMERAPETEFERGMRRFAVLIMRTVVFLALFVMLAGAWLQRDLDLGSPAGRAGIRAGDVIHEV